VCVDECGYTIELLGQKSRYIGLPSHLFPRAIKVKSSVFGYGGLLTEKQNSHDAPTAFSKFCKNDGKSESK